MISWAAFFDERTAPGAGGCVLWTKYTDDIGYGRADKRMTGENKAHRISWVLARGPIPAGKKVLHECDVRQCVNPAHLFLGTQADNVADMHAKGRYRPGGARGEANHYSKLTEAQVREMRRLAAGGRSQHSIAREFNVAVMTANRAIRGLCWAHVK